MANINESGEEYKSLKKSHKIKGRRQQMLTDRNCATFFTCTHEYLQNRNNKKEINAQTLWSNFNGIQILC